jgi:hypothetical protein
MTEQMGGAGEAVVAGGYRFDVGDRVVVVEASDDYDREESLARLNHWIAPGAVGVVECRWDGAFGYTIVYQSGPLTVRAGAWDRQLALATPTPGASHE